LPYTNCRVGNPILCSDGRQRIQIKYEDGRYSVMSYPKYLMECFLGRKFNVDETVDHIDCNPLNNDLVNLRVISQSKHAKLDCKRLKLQVFICPLCCKQFSLVGKQLHKAIANRKQGKAGPFCSRRCAGIYSTNLQYKRQEKLEAALIEPIYITLKSSSCGDV